jgi:hypothetical protein
MPIDKVGEGSLPAKGVYGNLLFEQALLLQLLTKERMPYYRTIGEMKQAREEFRQSD